MSKARRRRIVLLVAVVAVAILAVGGFTLKDRLIDAWLVHKLRSPAEATRQAAVDKLVARESRRGAAALIQIADDDAQSTEWALNELLRFGRPGVRELLLHLDLAEDDFRERLWDILEGSAEFGMHGQSWAAWESLRAPLAEIVGDDSEPLLARLWGAHLLTLIPGFAVTVPGEFEILLAAESAELRIVALLGVEEMALSGDEFSAPESLVAAVADLLSARDGFVRWRAARVLGVLASDVATVPTMLDRALLDNVPAVRVEAAFAVAVSERFDDAVISSLVTNLDHDDVYVRRSAAFALSTSLRDTAEPDVVATLLSRLAGSDDRTRSAFAYAIGKIGFEDAVSATTITGLVELLESVIARPDALRALGRLGHQAEGAGPAIIRILETSFDLQHRRLAIEALLDIGVTDPHAVEQLARVVRDGYRRHVLLAARVLEKIGTADSVDALASQIVHPRSDVRLAVARALGNPKLVGDVAAIEALTSCLSDEKSSVRWEAYHSLKQLGPQAERAIASVDKNFLRFEPTSRPPSPRDPQTEPWFTAKYEWWSYCEKTLSGLPTSRHVDATLTADRMRWWLATDDRQAVEYLIERSTHDDATVRFSAVHQLASPLTHVELRVAALVRTLEDRDVAVRVTAAGELGQIGPEAASAISALLDRLDAGHLSATLLALAEIAPRDPRVIAALTAGLASPDTAARTQSARGLALAPDLTHPAVPALRRLTQDRSTEVRLAAANALWKIDGDPHNVLSTTLALTSGMDVRLRRRAVESLGKLGEAAEPALPKLLELVSGEDENDAEIRRLAYQSILRIRQAIR